MIEELKRIIAVLDMIEVKGEKNISYVLLAIQKLRAIVEQSQNQNDGNS